MSASGFPKNFHAVVPVVAGIGNAIMAIPLVRQLKARAGAARVTVIARTDAMGEPFRRLPEVDDLILTRSAWHARTLRPDVFIVPFPSNRWQYSMLAMVSGARRTLLHGYPVGYWAALHFVGERVPAVRGLHDVQQNLRLLGDVADESESPRFALRDEDHAGARQLVGDARDFIAVHAGSAKTILAESKRWPTQRYAQLIDEMTMSGRTVFVLEGPDEAGVADEIAAHVAPSSRSKTRVVRLRGNLGVSGAMLQRAALYVGSDSGLAHLAAAVGTRPVTIFGPADPDRVCPYGYRDLVIQPPGIGEPSFLYPWHATKPKLRHDDALRIRQITVDTVISKVRFAFSLASPERVG